MPSADRVPVKSTQSKAAVARLGCRDLRTDRLGALSVHCPFQLRERALSAQLLKPPGEQAPYSVCRGPSAPRPAVRRPVGKLFVRRYPPNAGIPADSEVSGTKFGPGRLRSKDTARHE